MTPRLRHSMVAVRRLLDGCFSIGDGTDRHAGPSHALRSAAATPVPAAGLGPRRPPQPSVKMLLLITTICDVMDETWTLVVLPPWARLSPAAL